MKKSAIPSAAGIPVHCAHSKIVDVAALVPNPRNPNQHPPEQLQLLGRIIGYQGWRAPITVSTRSGFVVRGHGRLAAAQLMGWSEVPVDYQDYANEAAEWADLLADNRLAELSQWNKAGLTEVLGEINSNELAAVGMDMSVTGFDEAELAQRLEQIGKEEGAIPAGIDPGNQFGVIVICESEPHQEEVYNALTEHGYSCKVVVV